MWLLDRPDLQEQLALQELLVLQAQQEPQDLQEQLALQELQALRVLQEPQDLQEQPALQALQVLRALQEPQVPRAEQGRICKWESSTALCRAPDSQRLPGATWVPSRRPRACACSAWT